MVIKFLVSLIPVFMFLIMMVYLDSMKLVGKQLIILSLVWGLVSAGLSYYLNTFLLKHTGIGFETYSGFLAPVVEEFLKFSLLLYLIMRHRIGFMIDGAIYGFAIGAAFSFAENLFYLYNYTDGQDNMMIWITRGFGTAVMHGGATALFGIICMSALNRETNLLLAAMQGALSAMIIHGIYNQFLVSPVVSAAIMVVLVPMSVILVFVANEKTIRNWLELEFDAEVSMLRMIKRGKFSETKTGRYLVSIRDHFPSTTVMDMYCFISLYLELSMRAKSQLMLRESDIVIPADPELPAKLAELGALQKNIGRGGYLAIAPILRMKRKDLWKLSLLNK